MSRRSVWRGAARGTAFLVCLLAAAAPLSLRAQRSAPLARCGPRERPEQCLRRAVDAATSHTASRAAARSAARGGGPAELPPGLLPLLKDVCARGVGDGCYLAGRLLLTSESDAEAELVSLLQDYATDPRLLATQLHAADLFRAGCEPATGRASAAACWSAGDAFAFGMGPPTDPEWSTAAPRFDADSAFAYYRRGCALGNATACSREAALIAERTELGPLRAEAAERRSAEACRRDSPSGCIQAAAYTLERVRRVPPTRRTPAHRRESRAALAELRRTCRDGLLPACTRLGAAYADGTLGVDADSSRHYYRLGCPGPGSAGGWLGHGAACRELAALALAGGRRDTAEALRLYETGCRLFDPAACVEQGRLAPRTGDAEKDAFDRIALFAIACVTARPSGAACRATGEAFRRDLGDTVRAADFFRRACRLADAGGCLALGVVEDSLRRRPGAALKPYRLACELGDGGGCAGLSRLLRDVYRDGGRADRLLERGCGVGHAPACWELALRRDELADEEEVARLRAAACRFDRGYCKRKPR